MDMVDFMEKLEKFLQRRCILKEEMEVDREFQEDGVISIKVGMYEIVQ